MAPEHVDVLIVGAGLSGIGAAVHLQRDCPQKSFAIIEARDAIGGTWDLFRYPGIRSDSDMYTLGYRFKPWTNAKAIADGESIREYIRETAAEHRIEDRIHFGLRATRADWSSPEARWTVELTPADGGEPVHMTCAFLYTCSGYYRYDQGYTPDFPGIEQFAGTVIHPQHWPEDLDYTGKKVVVIGSGATAVTLVPAMTDKAAHVTMLQRSPTYIISLPGSDPIANGLRRVLPPKLAYAATRWKNVGLTTLSYQLSRRRPAVVKRALRRQTERQLPVGYDVDRHFKPRYDPWDQRLCLVPDGDLFRAIRHGKASVVTDTIETFTQAGIRLASGTELEADIVVTATGLNIQLLGGMQLGVDGEDVVPPEHLVYKGMMISDVPNMALALGYSNASWTLKADLTSEYVCRLINHMDATGTRQCTARNAHPGMDTVPVLDLQSGYVLRALEQLPKQGAQAPWRLHQNYALDIRALRRGALEDGVMEFSNPAPSPADLTATMAGA